MVLTEAIKMAAFTGNAAEVTAFLEKNPEGVDDVDDRSQIARGKVVATRSTPPHLARLFARSLPNEIAWRVLAFWNPRD
jgi:hypothetical protein